MYLKKNSQKEILSTKVLQLEKIDRINKNKKVGLADFVFG